MQIQAFDCSSSSYTPCRLQKNAPPKSRAARPFSHTQKPGLCDPQSPASSNFVGLLTCAFERMLSQFFRAFPDCSSDRLSPIKEPSCLQRRYRSGLSPDYLVQPNAVHDAPQGPRNWRYFVVLFSMAQFCPAVKDIFSEKEQLPDTRCPGVAVKQNQITARCFQELPECCASWHSQ